MAAPSMRKFAAMAGSQWPGEISNWAGSYSASSFIISRIPMSSSIPNITWSALCEEGVAVRIELDSDGC